MSIFRNFKPRSAFMPPRKIYVHQIIETPLEDGSKEISVSSVDASSFNIVPPSQYQLSNLVSAGVPLTVVSPNCVDVRPSDETIESVVNKVINSSKTE